MAFSTEVLDFLASRGLSASDMVELSRLIDAPEKRSSNADRQARYRERKKASYITGDVTDNVTESVTRNVTRNVTPPLDKETPPTPPKEINPLPPVSPKGDTTPQPENEILVDGDEHDQRLRPDEVVEAWNDLASDCGLPRIAKLTDQRRRQLSRRLRENTFDEFAEALRAIRRSRFCQGENDRGWRADFDFLLQPKSFARLLEGFYDGSPN